MSQVIDVTVGTRNPRLERLGPVIAAIAVVFGVYTATLWVAMDLSFAAALAGGAANTVPVVVFGAAAHHLIASRLVGRRMAIQVVGHLGLCAAFALLSFWFLIVLLGVANGVSPIEFAVRPFPLRATAWQLLENVTTYGVIAALSYRRADRLQIEAIPAAARTPPTSPAAPDREAEPREPEPSRYFVRSGEDIRPIDFDRVVSIGGADDYAEVTTLDAKHLVRMTLADFEKTLDAARFVRVHRSWIVNLDHVSRAEPAGGGRMLLHMRTGERIAASRAGSRLLRDRVI